MTAIPLSVSKSGDTLLAIPIPSGPADVLVRAIVGAQSILSQYLEPGGMSADQAVAILLGVLDHEEVVAAVAAVAQSRQTNVTGVA